MAHGGKELLSWFYGIEHEGLEEPQPQPREGGMTGAARKKGARSCCSAPSMPPLPRESRSGPPVPRAIPAAGGQTTRVVMRL
jgi:hypothetical protein